MAMHRILRITFILALMAAGAPSADAQIGRIIDRARSAVTGSGSSAPAPGESASDYARLMNTRFFVARGDFGFGISNGGGVTGRDQIIFPPSVADAYSVSGQYVVRTADGQVVGQQSIGTVQPTESAAFIRPNTSGAPQWRGSVEAGQDYTLDLEFEGALVGSVPFTVRELSSDDPFNPGSVLLLDGPWQTHAFFQHETDRPEYLMHFYAWVGPHEMATNKRTEISIRRSGQEVAWGRGFSNMTHGWGLVKYDLYKPEGRDDEFGRQVANAPRWGIQDVTPGTYEIQFSDESETVFRTMTIEGGAGAFVPHARSAIDFRPRSRYLTPRRMVGSRLDTPVSVYWIAPSDAP